MKARAFVFMGLAFVLAFALLAESARGSYPNIISGNIDAWDMSTLAAGKAKDFGSGAFDLTINGPTPTTGICAGAYAFDGINDDMTNAVNPIAALGSTYTIAMYVSKSSLSGTAYALRFASGSRAAVYGYTANTYQLYNGLFSGSIAISNTGKHWIVWTSGITGGLRGYLDGTLVSTNLIFSIGGSTGTFAVGSSVGGDYFGGTFDEIYIYSTELSASDVANIAPVCATPPTVSTAAQSSILCDRATLNGNLTSKGTSAIIAVGFLYGKNPTLAGATNHTVSTNASVGLFNFTATGLDASTFYYFRAWANGTDGYAQGSILFFQTSVCPPVTTCTPDQSGSNLLTLLMLSIVAAIVFLFGIRFNAGMLLLSGILTLSVGFAAFSATCNLIIGIAIELLGLMIILWTIGGIIDARKEGQT